MNLGEFRKLTAHLPDDAELFGDEGDVEAWELHLGEIYPPVLDLPYAVVLNFGQPVTEDIDYHARVDARLMFG